MQLPNRTLPKIMAVAFSALLAGGYVCHSARMDAKQPRQLPVTQHIAVSSSPEAPVAQSTQPVAQRRVLMPGSKSSAVDLARGTSQRRMPPTEFHYQGADSEASSGPVYPDPKDVDLGGFDSANHNAEPAPAPKKPLHRVFLPGSKSDRTGVYNPDE